MQKSTPYYCRIEFDECRDQLDFEDRDYLRGRARYEVYRLSDVNATDRYNIAIDTLICVRQLIENKVGGQVGVEVAATLVDELRASFESSREILGVQDRCQSVAQYSARVRQITREQQEMALRNAKASNQAKAFVKNFIKPQASCTAIGLSGDLGFILAGSAKVNAGACLISNGRKYLKLSLGVGGGVGAGFDVNIDYDEYDVPESYYERFKPFTVSYYLRSAVGLLGAVIFESDAKKISVTRPLQFGDMEFDKAGAGAGGFLVGAGRTDIKILPLGTDRDYLLLSFYNAYRWRAGWRATLHQSTLGFVPPS